MTIYLALVGNFVHGVVALSSATSTFEHFHRRGVNFAYGPVYGEAPNVTTPFNNLLSIRSIRPEYRQVLGGKEQSVGILE
jgi:hypothetical protein